MANAEAVTNTEYVSSDDESTKTFKDRLEDMPTYNIAVNNLQSLYSTMKGSGYFASAFSTGEDVAARITTAAKPVVLAATDMACKVARPVVGEIADPGASIDSCASEVLAKVQEKIPCMKQDPREYVEAAKSYSKDTANYYLDKVQGLAVTQSAVHKLDNAVAMTDLIVELCLPTDGSCAEDMEELEKAEADEDQGVIAHANNVRRKAYRRGTRKLMSYKHVQTTVDMVQYAQNQISETTGKLLKGSSYVASPTTTPPSPTTSSKPPTHEIPESLQGSTVAKSNDATEGAPNLAAELSAQGWDTVHQTSMYIPGKALEVTGEIYVSAKEMIFSYSNVNKMNKIPSAVTKTVESYYKNATENEVVKDIKEKAVAFAYVPTQVISNYVQSNRVVQWIIPNYLQTESIQVIENTDGTASESKK